MNIGYTFKNTKLFETAMTHISLANDTGIESNQRLEFLGDSVLSYIIASRIYELYPKCNEGELTKIRAMLVCEKTLAELTREMKLGEEIKFGKSEKMSNGANKDSILADTFEALLGAIFLDSDVETAKKWALKVFGKRIENVEIVGEINYKSELQIYFQKRDKTTDVVKYRLKSKTGPDHNPKFIVEAVYENCVIGCGTGKNRKIAEQAAAKAAFEGMKGKNEKI